MINHEGLPSFTANQRGGLASGGMECDLCGEFETLFLMEKPVSCGFMLEISSLKSFWLKNRSKKVNRSCIEWCTSPEAIC